MTTKVQPSSFSHAPTKDIGASCLDVILFSSGQPDVMALLDEDQKSKPGNPKK